MDPFDIYVNVERPSGNPGKRKTLGKCSDNIYANEDKIHTLEPKRHEPALSAAVGSIRVKKSSLRAAAVILGLLCLLLLTGLITLVFMLTKSNEMHEMKMVRLQASYNNLTEERNQLQTSYNNLTEERDQLQTSYNQQVTAFTKERNDLQRKIEDTEASLKDLTNKTEVLRRILKDGGWEYFRGSFYYVSSTKKTWQQSRDYCLQKGADLMIINSKEEQDYANQFKKYMWIGLTDSQTEGTWKWVDGTLLMTKSYWTSGEPNGGTHENCGDIKNYDATNSWNDESCSLSLNWVCERKHLQ
ncbi:CD209 antigen-like [Sparus aurata]|uniref:CD209 antigen-like n=1 Tax=Sparus aurata TaxID=8175 RepID=UPI0011C12846|nr:CD209 antigen-like [Sparus aurata]